MTVPATDNVPFVPNPADEGRLPMATRVDPTRNQMKSWRGVVLGNGQPAMRSGARNQDFVTVIQLNLFPVMTVEKFSECPTNLPDNVGWVDLGPTHVLKV